MANRTQQVLKETAIYGLGGAGTKFISFLLFPLYARLFNVDDYGAIEVINTFLALASIILTSGTDLAQSYYFYEYGEPEQRKKTISTLGIYILLINTLVALLVGIFSKQISTLILGDAGFAGLLQIAGLVIPWMGLYTFNLNLLRLERKPAVYISITLPFVLLQISTNILFVLFLHGGMQSIFWANLGCYVLFTLIGFFINRSYFSLNFDLPRFKEMFAYWRPLIPVNISAWFLASADRLILSSISTLAVTGIYSAGLRIASIVGFFVQAFRTANLPFIFEVSKDEDSSIVYQKTLSYYLYFSSLIAVAISLFAKPLLLLFSGKEYLAALSIIPPLAFIYVLSGSSQIVSIGSLISKNTKNIGIITFTSALLMGLGLLTFIPAYGAVGTAFIVLFSNLIYNLALYFNSQKSHPIPYEWKRVLRIFGISIAIIAVKMLIRVESLGMEILIGSGALLLFFLFTPLFSLLTTSEIKVLQKQIQLFIRNLFSGKKEKDEKVNTEL